MLDWSLLTGALPTFLIIAGIGGLAHLVVGRRGDARRTGEPIGRRWWLRTLPATVASAAVITVGAGLLITYVVRPFPDPLPLVCWLWAGLAVLGLALGVVDLRRGGTVHRLAVLGAALLVVLAGAQGINRYFGAYPTVRTALGIGYPDEVEFADTPAQAARLVRRPATGPLSEDWTQPPGLPATGRVADVDIPATVSGFGARSAWVYLPPAYLTSTRAQLPVLVLLAGQPGSPQDWLDGGLLAERMDRYAAAHQGLAPVVVVADGTGDQFANPLCMDSELGNAATYLTVDVPAWIRRHLQVDPDPSSWAVGGLSYGGTCALQLALTAPTVYPSFVDISGQSEPSLGDRARTVRAAFGSGRGADAAFHAVNPLDLLKNRRNLQTAGWMVAGADDAEYAPQARTVFAAVQAARIPVQLTVLPGGHTWQVWGPGLESALPWLGTRLHLTP